MRDKKKGLRTAKHGKIFKFWESRYFFAAALIFLSAIVFLRSVKESKWDGASRFTLVFSSEPLAIFSIEPRSKRLLILVFPGNTILDVPYGYGTYPAASVFRLGTLDSKRGGALLLSKSIENTFGVVVEGFFASKTGTLSFPNIDEEELAKIKKSYFSTAGLLISFPKVLDLKKRVNTNISFIDLFRLWNAVRKLRSNQITVLNIEKTNALSDDKLPDGTNVKIVNRDLFDFVISNHFQDQLIRSQNETIEVVNASSREKLAASFSRMLSNLGANVISKTSAEKDENFSCLIVFSGKNLKDSFLVKRLREIYACDFKNELSSQEKADIKIILGEQFIK